jgi:hypothetical protein
VGLPRRLLKALRALASHDRYAGLMGLLPKGYSDLLTWTLMGSGLDLKTARLQAASCVMRMRATLFDTARHVFATAKGVSENWLNHLDGPVLLTQIDVFAQAAHERSRKVVDTRFAASRARALERRSLCRSRRHICNKLGIPSMRYFLELYPGWTVASAPRQHRALLLDLPDEVHWSREGDGNRLRTGTRKRPYDDGAYVMLPEEIRALARVKRRRARPG